jgi:hypothetical protein
MDNLRKCLQYALETAGHNVEFLCFEQDEAIKKNESEAKSFIRREYSQEIFNASEFDSIEEAKRATNRNCDKKTQRRIEKTFLIDRLPGIQDSNVWDADFIYNCYSDNKEFIRQIERFWLLQNFEVSQKRHESKWFYEVTREDFYSARVKLMSHDVIWGLRELNILGFIGQEYHKNSQTLIDFIATLRQRVDIQQALRIEQLPSETFEGDERIKILGRLLNLIGYKNYVTCRKVFDGVRLNHYQCVPVTFGNNEPDKNGFDIEAARLEILSAVENRFLNWMQSDKAVIDWNSVPQEKPKPQQQNEQDIKAAINVLKTATTWLEVSALGQTIVDMAWKYLTPEDDARLRRLYELSREISIVR